MAKHKDKALSPVSGAAVEAAPVTGVWLTAEESLPYQDAGVGTCTETVGATGACYYLESKATLDKLLKEQIGGN